jgi:hypothetical protein
MIDKDKTERALLDFGLSTRRSKELADYLSSQELEKQEEKKKRKSTIEFKDVSEVKPETKI